MLGLGLEAPQAVVEGGTGYTTLVDTRTPTVRCRTPAICCRNNRGMHKGGVLTADSEKHNKGSRGLHREIPFYVT